MPFRARYSCSVISDCQWLGRSQCSRTTMPRDLDAVRLDVEAVDAVVAGEGVGHDEYLAGERRVGEGLLVAGHAGREDDLAGRAHVRAEGLALVRRAVLQDQERLLAHYTFTSRAENATSPP